MDNGYCFVEVVLVDLRSYGGGIVNCYYCDDCFGFVGLLRVKKE